MNAWQRQPNETAAAYDAFKTYRDLGRTRSTDAAWRAAKGQQEGSKRRAPGKWTKWSSEHDWVNRAEAYDEYLQQKTDAAKLRAIEQKAADWAEREINMADAMMNKAQDIINMPIVETESQYTTTDPNDGTVTHHHVTIRPARFATRDAATIVAAATKIRRLAMGEDTDRRRVIIDVKRSVLAAMVKHRRDFPDVPEEMRLEWFAEDSGLPIEELASEMEN